MSYNTYLCFSDTQPAIEKHSYEKRPCSSRNWPPQSCDRGTEHRRPRKFSPPFPVVSLPTPPTVACLYPPPWGFGQTRTRQRPVTCVTQIFASLLCSNVGLGSQHWQYQSPLFISQALTCCFSHLSKAHKALKMKNPFILNPSKVYMFQYMICIFRYFTHSIWFSLRK